MKTSEFFALFLDDWRLSLCLMATFGQKIPTALITYPSLGLYNFRHSGPTWPSYPGPDPIAAMVCDGRTHLVLTIHKVTDVIDGGEVVARSARCSRQRTPRRSGSCSSCAIGLPGIARPANRSGWIGLPHEGVEG